MTDRGFTLVEMLLACALLGIVAALIATLVAPLGFVVARAEASALLEPAGRSAMHTLIAELQQAGADAVIGRPQDRVARTLARVWPTADLDSAGFQSPGGALRIMRVANEAQAVLQLAAAGGASVLAIDTLSRCRGGPPACGFAPGDRGVLYNDVVGEAVQVTAAGGGLLALSAPIGNTFLPGAVVAASVTNVYGVRPTPDGSGRLVRRTDGGAEQPVLDGVVGFVVTLDTVNPAAVDHVTLVLRLEAPTILRGPLGAWFRRAGSAQHASAWLPDAELRIDVALRNPSGVQ